MAKVEEIKIDQLVPDDHNFNEGTEFGQHLMEKSLSEYGIGRGILLDKNNRIISGNKTTETAAALGFEKVIVVETEGDTLVAVRRKDLNLDAERGKGMALADNATAKENIKFNLPEIEDVTKDMDLNPADWGIDLEDIKLDAQEAAGEQEIIEDDFNEEKDAIIERCNAGDVWRLGEHRLICGDSTKAETYTKLMAGEKAVLCFTDPPYGMKKESEGVLNDNLNYEDLLQFNKLWIPLTFENIKENGSWYCWGIDEPLMDIYAFILRPMQADRKLTFRNLITWDKGNGQGQLDAGRRMYATADEKCLFVMMGQQEYGRDLTTWYEGFERFRKLFSDELKKAGLTMADAVKITGNTYTSHATSRSQYSFPTKEIWNKLQDYCRNEAFKQEYEAVKQEYEAVKQEYEAVKQEYEAVKQEWYDTRAYFDNTHDNMNNVWHFERTSKEERVLTGGHATPKPISLCARGIKSSSNVGDCVLDCFGGSGSTLIACEQLGRKCYMIELSQYYCDAIIERWEKLTGKKAELLNR